MTEQQKTEERIQYEIVCWYRNNYCLKMHSPQHLIFSVPNDGKNLAEQMRKKSTGMMAGVSDFIVIQQNKVLFFEVKTETGKPQPNQKDFEASVTALGFEYHLVRSLEHFKKIITETI